MGRNCSGVGIAVPEIEQCGAGLVRSTPKALANLSPGNAEGVR